MRQTAQVKRVLDGGMAEVSVTRQGACSHNCSECGGCNTGVLPTVTACAVNPVGAREGDMVLIETPSDKLLGVAALVYLLPVILLIGGYLAGAVAGFGSGLCIFTGLICFAASIGLILLLDRYVKSHRTFQFSIVGFKGT